MIDYVRLAVLGIDDQIAHMVSEVEAAWAKVRGPNKTGFVGIFSR